MISMFEFARPALQAAGIKLEATWEETQVQTLNQAKAQLARRDLRPETAAKWNKRAFIVLAAAGRDSRLDPRSTARNR